MVGTRGSNGNIKKEERQARGRGPTVRDPSLEGSSTGSRHKRNAPRKQWVTWMNNKLTSVEISRLVRPTSGQNLSTPLIAIPEHHSAYVSCHHMLCR